MVIDEPLDVQSELQPADVKWPPEIPTDTVALKLVVEDMKMAESWLEQTGAYTEWARADRLFQADVPVSFWEGTNVPRAHLGVPLVAEHTESILPQIVNGLFFDTPPFLLKPRPGTKMEAARANSAVLEYELEKANFREEIRLLAKCALLYGTGIGKWRWHSEKQRIAQLVQTDPNNIDAVEMRPVEIEMSKPVFEALDLRTVFIDPSLRLPDIRKAKYVVQQAYLTIEQIDALRDQEGYEIPDRDTLVGYFFPPKEPASQSAIDRHDNTLDLEREFKPESPEVETSIDPLKMPLEVLEYWTPDRCIVVLQRKLVLRNSENEWGVIPYVSCPFVDVLHQFYGLGLSRIVGNEQRLQQGIINSRLDDLSLRLNGMFVRVRGANAPTQQVRMRPGGIIDVDQENGVQLLQRDSGVPDAFAEVAASDDRAQRRSGASAFVTQGALPSSGTSALVKAAGVNTLAGGTVARLQYFTENLSNLVFVPVLQSFMSMNRGRLKPSELQRLLGELSVEFAATPLEILNANAEVSILAASKLQARQAMAASLPLLLQFLLNEPVLQQLALQGKKVNFEELVNMVFDVSAWPNRRDVIVPQDEADAARQAAQNPAIQQAMMEQQKQAGEAQLIEEKTVAQAGRDVIRGIIKDQFESTLGGEGGR